MGNRGRLALIFAGLWLACYLLLGATLSLLARRFGAEPGAAAGLAALGALALLPLLVLAWLHVDRRILLPLRELERGMRMLVDGRLGQRPLELPRRHDLGGLPDALGHAARALGEAERDKQRAIETATLQVAEQKGWLEVILQGLSEGVLVCNRSHQILLYNEAAMRMLGRPEMTGLGRPVFGLLSRAPILHAIERLERHVGERSVEADQPPRPEELATSFVCGTADARLMLRGRLGIVQGEGGQWSAYAISLVDISDSMPALARAESLRRAIGRDLRSPLANLRAAAETLAAFPGMEAEKRQEFDQILLKESAALSERLEMLTAELRAEKGGHWPMADIYGEDLLNCLARRLREGEAAIELTMTGAPLWLHGDSLSLMLASERLVRRLHAHLGIRQFDAELLLGDRRVYLDIGWNGTALAAKELDGWIDERIEDAPGGLSMRDILERHGSEIWSQSGRHPGSAVIRIPLIPPLRGQFSPPAERLPPRPEFYDFSLMHGHSGNMELSSQRLDDLTFVVFDTETTGLEPDQGDEIVSIAGVRVVKGRVLTGETFERLVNPGRPVPAASTRFHGITDADVADKPPIQIVLPQFMDFSGDAVLVAHNAPFDLKFLHLHETEANVAIRNAALDTLLLSALLDPQESDHSLDTLLDRYGVRLIGRHTALGDAMATAEILVRMIARLRDRGLVTFGDVQAASMPLARRRRDVAPMEPRERRRAGEAT